MRYHLHTKQLVVLQHVATSCPSLLLQVVSNLQWMQYDTTGNETVRNGNRVLSSLGEKLQEWKVPTRAGELVNIVLQ